MEINRILTLLLIMGYNLLCCQGMSAAMIEKKIKRGDASSISGIVYGRGEQSFEEVNSKQEAYNSAKKRALLELSESISVSVQNEQLLDRVEQEKNGEYTTSDLYKSTTTISSGTLIKNFRRVTTSNVSGNDTVVYCWKYIKDVEKETKVYNRNIGKNINEFIRMFENDKERSVHEKLAYIFSAYNENKKQVKGYRDTFDLSLSKIEVKVRELQENLGLTLELKNKPDILSVGEKYQKNIELKFIKNSNHFDLKNLKIKVKLVSGLLDDWNPNGIEIEKINSLEKIILPIGKVLSNEKIRIELDFDFTGLGINDPIAIERFRKILYIENNIINIEVNPKILISFDELYNYKFSDIESVHIEEINNKFEGLESTEKYKWISKRLDQTAPFRVSIENLYYSKDELYATFIVKDVKGDIISKSKQAIVLSSNSTKYKIFSQRLDEINNHIGTLVENVTSGELSINLNTSENSDINNNVGFNIYKFSGHSSIAEKVNSNQIKFSTKNKSSPYIEELSFGYYIVESRKDLDNKYYRQFQDTILISKKLTEIHITLVRSQSILDLGKIETKDGIDITISKRSDKLFGSRSNHISIIGSTIDESRSDIDNFVNRIEGSKIILSPDVYTLKVKTRGIPTINSSPINLTAEDSRALFKVENLLSNSSKPILKILPFAKPFAYNESLLSKTIKTTVLASSILILYNSVINVSKKFKIYEEKNGEYGSLVDVEQMDYDNKKSELDVSIDSYSTAQTNFYYSFGASVLAYGLTVTLSF